MKHLKLYEYWTTDTTFSEEPKLQKDPNREKDIKLFDEMLEDFKNISLKNVTRYYENTFNFKYENEEIEINVYDDDDESYRLIIIGHEFNKKSDGVKHKNVIKIYDPPKYINKKVKKIISDLNDEFLKFIKKEMKSHLKSANNYYVSSEEFIQRSDTFFTFKFNFNQKHKNIKINDNIELIPKEKDIIEIKDLIYKLSYKSNKKSREEIKDRRISYDSERFGL